MRLRRLIVVTLLLLVFGGIVMLRPVRIRVAGYLQGENFFEGLPTSYWREQALEHAGLRRLRSRMPGAVICVPLSSPRLSVSWDELLFWYQMLGWDGTLYLLKARLTDNGPDFRLWDGIPSGTEVLVALLRDDDVEVRHSACEGIAQIGPPAAAALPALIELLAGSEATLQGPATEALGKIGAAAVPHLLARLADSPPEKEALVVALGMIGPDAAPAIPVLCAALKGKRGYSAAKALSCIGSQALPALQEAMESADHDVRWNAAIAMSDLRADPHVLAPIFIKMLEGPHGHFRQQAAAGLGRLGADGQEGVPALIEALRYRYMRREAVDALGWIGPNAQLAAPALTRLLEEEEDAYIRGCIDRALEKIQSGKQ